MTLLSNTAIKRHMEWGSVVIEPFHEEQLNNTSYDLTLGHQIARYKDCFQGIWDPETMSPAEEFKIEDAKDNEFQPHGFLLHPYERVLGHSREIAGGRQISIGMDPTGRMAVTSQLHATSTAARIGIQVCGCAGFGDVGFISPWVYEITNLSPRKLFLPVGAVIAQVSFFEVEPILEGTSYDQTGTYQKQQTDPKQILKEWTLEKGLPRKLKVRP